MSSADRTADEPAGAAGAVGVDVGGTAVKACRVDCAGTVHDRVELAAPASHDPAAVVAAVAAAAGRLGAAGGDAVGVAVPGIVDEPGGIVVFGATYGWRGVPLRALLERALDRPVRLGHDVRSAGFAEWTAGAGRGAAGMLFLTLGTSIGAAVVSDGAPLLAGGYAGQLGHVVVDPEGDRCSCGQRGCLATLASAAAIAHRYAAAAGLPVDAVDAAEVARRARAGDHTATAVWAAATGALAGSLATAVAVLAPEVVVLGGGLARAGEQLAAPVRAGLAARVGFQRAPAVRLAAHGHLAGCLGAALLALRGRSGAVRG